MKYDDVKGKPILEMRNQVKAIKTDLFVLKMKNALGQLGNPLEIRSKRKDLAKVLTAISAKGKES